MAKYKDYPVYTYDEPATYSDFSGGINTDPSNEHLQPNEMRDCLNMHYSSAALVKRKGASLLCNIKCEEDLHNIQGVFIFTYRITYIIIAADGKLYQGVYSPNSTIEVSRLRIKIKSTELFNKYNPYDTSVGLNTSSYEQTNIQHEGFIYSYLSNPITSEQVILEDYNYVGDYKTLPVNYSFEEDSIVLVEDTYYLLNPSYDIQHFPITKTVITPDDTDKWISLTGYNTLYAEDIKTKKDPLHSLSEKELKKYNLVLKDNTYWEAPISSIQEWEESSATIPVATLKVYNNTIKVCIQSHSTYENNASFLNTQIWTPLQPNKELIFQNYLSIEAATYNNKLYITTGTRFVVVELLYNNLEASVVTPYACSMEEITNIGYNFLSPYPELACQTRYDQAITSIGSLLVIPQSNGLFKLQPVMNFARNTSERDYYFKWEKKIDTDWVTIYSYKDNVYTTLDSSNNLIQEKLDLYTIEVDDADRFQYRVSFAKSFEQPISHIQDWDYFHGEYTKNDLIKAAVDLKGEVFETFRCIKTHNPQKVIWDNINYDRTKEKINEIFKESYATDQYNNYCPETTPLFSTSTSTKPCVSFYTLDNSGEFVLNCHDTNEILLGDTYWEQAYMEEPILTLEGVKYDWQINKIDGEFFGQAVSITSIDLQPEDTFNIIHSCRKITSDGNKFLLYDDRYNSGSWYKTIINNPTYITQRGGLSFKTVKNESLIKVIPFNGTLIAFANAENVGGSIHMVTGNGDDWDDKSGYYSPYRRSIINATVSCDNASTVQVCENILIFKYFDTLYYISGSELNNEVVSVYSCNDKIKHNNNFVKIPWDDNDCISEATEDYYALIWKEKYIIEDEELVLDRPALKIKMYYKLGIHQNEKIVYPWLRDESEYFNISHIVYIKGKPIYLYNNTLLTFNDPCYTDLNNIYKCLVHFRGEDLNYPKMTKLISNVLVYYHRSQNSLIDFDLLVSNEAGHTLLDSKTKRFSLQDLRALRSGESVVDGQVRLDATILDSKVFNTTYKFPCLLADSIISATNDKEFSISSITYNYITSETPDQTQYDLYTNILRPKEVK